MKILSKILNWLFNQQQSDHATTPKSAATADPTDKKEQQKNKNNR